MRQARLRLIAAEHAGNLGGTGIAGYLVQMRLGNVAGLFTDHVMLVGHDRNLCQVRYDDDLMRGGKIGQHASKSTSRGAADTGINLVKYQCVDAVRITQDYLARKHDATELTARGDAAQRARREAGAAAI